MTKEIMIKSQTRLLTLQVEVEMDMNQDIILIIKWAIKWILNKTMMLEISIVLQMQADLLLKANLMGIKLLDQDQDLHP